MRGFWYLTLGSIAFVAITYFEQLPIIGWLGGIVSVAAWVVIARALVGEGGFDFETPFGVGWSAVIGAVTGFVGAFTAWLAQTGNLVDTAGRSVRRGVRICRREHRDRALAALRRRGVCHRRAHRGATAEGDLGGQATRRRLCVT